MLCAKWKLVRKEMKIAGCNRQYMMCGVRSSVNNSTLCRCARSPLGRSHMEHCQHQLLGHIQYIITRGGEGEENRIRSSIN